MFSQQTHVVQVWCKTEISLDCQWCKRYTGEQAFMSYWYLIYQWVIYMSDDIFSIKTSDSCGPTQWLTFVYLSRTVTKT